jgi:Domain of unknown function (DUF4259)
MGTWGHRNFENDSALDFIAEVEERGTDRIEEAIRVVANYPADDVLESEDCVAALAAIEYVAAAKGKQAEDFPEDAEDWLQKTGPGSLLSIDSNAITSAIERIRSNSELRELWNEGKETDQWLAVLGDLEKRLS